jgi:hypothetical protein
MLSAEHEKASLSAGSCAAQERQMAPVPPLSGNWNLLLGPQDNIVSAINEV